MYDKGLFDCFPNAEKVLKIFLFVTRGRRRRADLEDVNDIIQWLRWWIQFEKKAISNTKNNEVLSYLSLHDVGIYLRDGPFSKNIGIVNLHPSKGTHWVAHRNKSNFDGYGCSPPQRLSKVNIKRNGHCLCFDSKIQRLTNGRGSHFESYCLYICYSTKFIGIDFKSAVLIFTIKWYKNVELSL